MTGDVGRMAALVLITTAVAAAASVPRSSTSMYALCATAPICSGSAPVMPPKSASPPNASVTPSRCSAGMRSNAASSRNLGSDSVTWCVAVPASRPPRPAAATFGRSAASGPSGSSTAMARPMSRYGSSTAW